jgi:hypothetical protein
VRTHARGGWRVPDPVASSLPPGESSVGPDSWRAVAGPPRDQMRRRQFLDRRRPSFKRRWQQRPWWVGAPRALPPPRPRPASSYSPSSSALPRPASMGLESRVRRGWGKGFLYRVFFLSGGTRGGVEAQCGGEDTVRRAVKPRSGGFFTYQVCSPLHSF